MLSSLRVGAQRLGACVVVLGTLVLTGCDGDEHSGTPTADATAGAVAVATPMPGCDAIPLTADAALRAMLVVQKLVVTWNLDPSSNDPALTPPSPVEIQNALDTLRCDRTPRGVSRHRRAFAKLLGYDWNLVHAAPYLQTLGFPHAATTGQLNANAIGAFKSSIVAEYSQPIFTLHAQDPRWVEYVILRRLTTSEHSPATQPFAQGAFPFGPAPAQAQTSPTPSCWQPEFPSTYDYVRPYIRLTAHVSVVIDPMLTEAANKQRVQANVDPTRWNDCGRFWSPPVTPPDGAWAVASPPTPTPGTTPGTCVLPQEPFQPESPPIAPGGLYGARYLFEHFFVPGTSPGMEIWIRNILGIMATGVPRTLSDGTITTAYRIDYSLPVCGTTDGALGGGVLGKPLKTILDSGAIEVWTEGSRTHVAASKIVEFDKPLANWVTQLNPALHELNEQLGELACCL
jgi:hypothetical protein